MKRFYIRLLLLTWGLFLYALGIVFTLNANVGYAPWDVFHVGIAKTMGISIGTASILVGVIIGMIAVFLGEKTRIWYDSKHGVNRRVSGYNPQKPYNTSG